MCNSDHVSGLPKLALKKSHICAQALKWSLVCSGCGRCCSVGDVGRSRLLLRAGGRSRCCREVVPCWSRCWQPVRVPQDGCLWLLGLCPSSTRAHSSGSAWQGHTILAVLFFVSRPGGVAVKTRQACILSVLAAAGRSMGRSVGVEVCTGWSLAIRSS